MRSMRGPFRLTTTAGVIVSRATLPAQAHEGDPGQMRPSLMWQEYQPQDSDAACGHLMLIHTDHLSGQIYHHFAQALALGGMHAYVPTLRYHGKPEADTCPSASAQALEQSTLADYVTDCERIMRHLEVPREQLVLAGHGMGGILAQLLARRNAYAGICLLSSCATHLAARVWNASPVHRSVSKRAFSRPQISEHSTLEEVYTLLLGGINHSSYRQHALAVWQQLCPESPRIFEQSYPALEREGPQPLLTRHALLLSGHYDPFITEAVHQATLTFLLDSGCQVTAARLPLAPHLLFLSDWLVVGGYLARFCRSLGSGKETAR